MPAAPTEFYDVVRLVPAGRVVTYGDLASLFGCGPRLAGRHMSRNPHLDLPWWRVVSAAGKHPPELLPRALPHWRAEGTPLNRDGTGVAMRAAHADLPALASLIETRIGPLPGLGE